MSQLVLWSGGLDSTLALYRALTGNGSDGAWNTFISKKGAKLYNTRTLTVTTKQFAGQRWLPRARKNISKAMSAAGLYYGEVSVDLAGNVQQAGPGISIQPATWIALGSLHATVDEDVWVSWNRDEIGNVDAARAAFDALQRISHKTGKLVFPLELYTKSDVIVELGKAHVRGLVEASWWCEGTGTLPAAKRRYSLGKPCGICAKCEEITTARYRIANLRRPSDLTGNKK